MNIDGASAIVTGGSSGLGKAVAIALAEQGARVTVLDRKEPLDSQFSPETIRFSTVDITDADAVSSAMDEAEAVFGTARILVNCAGIPFALPLVDAKGDAHPVHSFRRIIEINLVSAFQVSAQFAARLSRMPAPAEGERGVIIHTASIAGFDGQYGESAYAASKAGLAAMTLPMARDLGRFAIRVVSVAPGLFATRIMGMMSYERTQTLVENAAWPKRAGEPEEFAQLAVAIITNPMLNGETIRLDGGLRLVGGQK